MISGTQPVPGWVEEEEKRCGRVGSRLLGDKERARMTRGKLSMSARKVYFKLRVASVIDTHAFSPNSVSGGKGKDCYFPLCLS